MTRRLIPERTVDSMFSSEVVRAFPHAIVWSPTNTAGQIDHEVSGLGNRVLVFECKGTVSDNARDPSKPWKTPLDYSQMAGYVSVLPHVRYLLPAKPPQPQVPWIRSPCTDPDGSGACRACASPKRKRRTSRRWAGDSPHVQMADIHVRIQPWFAHWSWVVPVVDLDAFTARKGRPAELPSADTDLQAIPNAERLCHFLNRIRRSSAAQDAVAREGINWPRPWRTLLASLARDPMTSMRTPGFSSSRCLDKYAW